MNDEEFDELRETHSTDYHNNGFIIHGKLITGERFYRIVDLIHVRWNEKEKYGSYAEYMQTDDYKESIRAEAVAMLRRGWPDTRIEGGWVSLDKIKTYIIRETQSIERYYWPTPEELIQWEKNKQEMLNDPTLEYNPKTGGFTKKKT